MSDQQDPHGLERFVMAQQGDWERARRELQQGRKRSHWMWFVLPQLDGLGSSMMARQYAISGLDEARAYLAHPVLGPRLVEAATIIADGPTDSAEQLMGGIDAVKLRSSMTLFQAADPQQAAFGRVLERYWDGEPDPRTLELLGR